ncbi:unnamed protein product [Mytilus coruscus]|uniref:Uncharacterized protein n=1 Tax=Mytilus coruscus TaxID=42192 RepID=A0A6J8D8Y0_MYTCO|nr:unnamed protein product [Mytilus coruscus]
MAKLVDQAVNKPMKTETLTKLEELYLVPENCKRLQVPKSKQRDLERGPEWRKRPGPPWQKPLPYFQPKHAKTSGQIHVQKGNKNKKMKAVSQQRQALSVSDNITVINTVDNFTGGKLKSFIKNWEKLTSDAFILNAVKGYTIELDEIPKQNFRPDHLQFDSSKTGWGGINKTTGKKTEGFWSAEEREMHINVLELKAAFLTLQSLAGNISQKAYSMNLDNTVAISYIENFGGKLQIYIF